MTTIDLPTLARPGTWIDQAACRNADRTLFFPERGDSVTAAKAICAHCPVRDACLRYALDDPSIVGIWGGTSGRERRAIRMGVPVGQVGRPRVDIKHGTVSGASAHQRRGEQVCDACREAKRIAGRDQRAARRAVAA